MTTTVRRFESVSALAEYGDGLENGNLGRDSRSGSDERFYGTRTWQEALTLAREGWSDIRPDVERIADKVRPHAAEYTQDAWTWEYDVVGDFPDVGRYLEGEPECMVSPVPTRVAKHGRVVTVLVNTSASGNIQSEQIQARGAAIVSLIEVLAVMGHTVELWIEDGTQKGTNSITYLVKVKGAADTLDTDEVMYALAHPAIQRRLFFAAYEREPVAVRHKFGFMPGRGYGTPVNTLTQGDAVGADVSIASPQYNDPIITDPVTWVKMVLKQLGLLPAD